MGEPWPEADQALRAWTPTPPVPRWTTTMALALLKRQPDPFLPQNSTTAPRVCVDSVQRVYPPDARGLSCLLALGPGREAFTAWINAKDELAYIEAGW